MGRMSTLLRLDVGWQGTSVTANFGQTEDVRISVLLDHASFVFPGDYIGKEQKQSGDSSF